MNEIGACSQEDALHAGNPPQSCRGTASSARSNQERVCRCGRWLLPGSRQVKRTRPPGSGRNCNLVIRRPLSWTSVSVPSGDGGRRRAGTQIDRGAEKCSIAVLFVELFRIEHKNALPCVYWDLVPRAPERETRASQPQLLLVALFGDREV